MTVIADIYTECVDVIETALPTHVRIPDPYNITTNTFLHMRNSYGIGVGPGTDTERYVGCLVTWARTYNIILVQQITTTQNNIDAREIIEKSLLDSHDALRKAFYLNSNLGGLAIKSTVLSDGGIIPLDIGGVKFLSLEMVLEVEYQEDPNT